MDIDKCEFCVYFNDPLFKESDCDKCKDNDGFLGWEDFNEDMDMYHIPPEEFKPEINKKRYFIIRWLINLILRYENNYASVQFIGIAKQPQGKKQNYEAPLYLNWYFKDVWIKEMYNGGYSGDIYGGTMYLRLLPGMYLAFEYDM